MLPCAQISDSFLAWTLSFNLCAPPRLAAELAAEGAAGPGSLRVGLLDKLHSLTEAQIQAGARVSVDAA